MKIYSQPYEKYIVSHNEWVDDFPSEWGKKRVKDLFRLVTDMAPDNNNFELLSLYTSIGVRPRKDLEARGNKASSTDGYWIVKKGDIVVNKLLAWMGAIGLSNYNGVTSPAYDILRKLNSMLDERYFAYLFRTEKAQQIFKKYSRGIMDMRLRLYFDKFGSITVPVPPFSSQKSIANYLDTKTGQIDRKIDLLTQKATKYGKLKQSLINETVTRGLDKTVAMKNSGVEWIGDVPENWEVRRVKDLFVESKRKSMTGKETLLSVSEYNGVTQKKDNIAGDEFLTTAVTLVGYKICCVDELVINIMLAWKRGLGVSPFYGIVSPSYAVYSPYKLACSAYFHYLFRSERAIVEFKRNSTGIIESRLRLYTDSFYALNVAIPEYKEQKAITDYLDTKTAHIDRIIKTINTQIEKLKELRKTLINDVVTGKIKVYQEVE